MRCTVFTAIQVRSPLFADVPVARLSRRKQGFESPRERHSPFVHFDFLLFCLSSQTGCFGLGKSVRLVSFQFCDSVCREPRLIGVTRLARVRCPSTGMIPLAVHPASAGRLPAAAYQRVFQCDRQYSTSVCQNTISDRKAASISVANII